jgi:hypothetical protein
VHAALCIVELPSVFLARGSGEDIHQDIRGDVWLAHNPPQALAVLAILIQSWLCCIVIGSSQCGVSKVMDVAHTQIGFHRTRTLRERDCGLCQRDIRDGVS